MACNGVQWDAIPCNSVQWDAMVCNDMVRAVRFNACRSVGRSVCLSVSMHVCECMHLHAITMHLAVRDVVCTVLQMQPIKGT